MVKTMFNPCLVLRSGLLQISGPPESSQRIEASVGIDQLILGGPPGEVLHQDHHIKPKSSCRTVQNSGIPPELNKIHRSQHIKWKKYMPYTHFYILSLLLICFIFVHRHLRRTNFEMENAILQIVLSRKWVIHTLGRRSHHGPGCPGVPTRTSDSAELGKTVCTQRESVCPCPGAPRRLNTWHWMRKMWEGERKGKLKLFTVITNFSRF